MMTGWLISFEPDRLKLSDLGLTYAEERVDSIPMEWLAMALHALAVKLWAGLERCFTGALRGWL